MQPKWLVVVGALVAAMLAAPAEAQQTGALKGYVTDEQGGRLPGVTITISSAELMGVRTAVTDAEGYYRFVSLPPGDYRIEAALAGFRTYVKGNLRVQVDSTTTEDITLGVAAVSEQVTVQATAPVIDVETAVRAFNINQAAISSIPVAPRLSYQDIWLVTPGVTRPFTPQTGTGQTTQVDPHVNAGLIDNDSRSGRFQNDSYENKIFIDGMDANDPMSGQSNTQLNYEAIEEISIKAAGAEAEFGNARSAQMQVITKSGGNQIRGSMLLQAQPRSFNWANVEGASSQKASYFNPAISIGGPVVRDKLWYFGTWKYDYENFGYPNTVVVTDLTRERRGNLIYMKGTAQVSAKHNVSVSFGWDRIKFANAATDADPRYSVPEAMGDQLSGGPLVSARWLFSVSNNFLIQATGGFNRKPSERHGQGDGPRRRYYDIYRGNLQRLEGNTEADYVSRRDALYFHANATYLPNRSLAGRHEFKFGGEARPHQDITRAFIYNADSNGFYSFAYGLDYATYGLTKPYLYEASQCFPHCGPFNSVTVKAYSLYVQDRWHPVRGLTLNLGLRWERSIEDMHDRDKLPVSVEQFDPNIRKNVEFDDNRFAPRLGFAYSMGPRGVIRGNYGRYQEFVGTGDYNNYPNAIGFNTWRVLPQDFGRGTEALYLFTAGTVPVNANFDRNMQMEYNDEYLFSYERPLPWDFAMDATFVYRRINNSDASDANVVFAPDGSSFTRKDPNWDRVNMRWFPTGDARYQFFDYKSIQLGLRRNFSRRTGVMVNYSRFWRKLDSLTFDPTEPEQFVYPNADSLDQVNFDYRWNLRTSVFFNFPRDVAVSVYLDVLSGQWRNNLTGDYVWNADAPRVRLPNGRTVADFIWQARNSYYAGKDWGAQGRMTDTERNVNVRLQKGFAFGRYTADASIDFFNVFNSLMYHGWESYDVRNPRYAIARDPQAPRVAQLNVRFRF